jgi:hypothetical protein
MASGVRWSGIEDLRRPGVVVYMAAHGAGRCASTTPGPRCSRTSRTRRPTAPARGGADPAPARPIRPKSRRPANPCGSESNEVAEIAGLHRTAIGMLENRKRMPGLGTVICLALRSTSSLSGSSTFCRGPSIRTAIKSSFKGGSDRGTRRWPVNRQDREVVAEHFASRLNRARLARVSVNPGRRPWSVSTTPRLPTSRLGVARPPAYRDQARGVWDVLLVVLPALPP